MFLNHSPSFVIAATVCTECMILCVDSSNDPGNECSSWEMGRLSWYQLLSVLIWPMCRSDALRFLIGLKCSQDYTQPINGVSRAIPYFSCLNQLWSPDFIDAIVTLLIYIVLLSLVMLSSLSTQLTWAVYRLLYQHLGWVWGDSTGVLLSDPDQCKLYPLLQTEH